MLDFLLQNDLGKALPCLDNARQTDVVNTAATILPRAGMSLVQALCSGNTGLQVQPIGAEEQGFEQQGSRF